jgi:hypothetical protein
MVNDRLLIPGDPSIRDLPTEEAVVLLMRVYGESEATARLMVGIAKGEIEGDALAVSEDGEASRSNRRRLAQRRAGARSISSKGPAKAG